MVKSFILGKRKVVLFLRRLQLLQKLSLNKARGGLYFEIFGRLYF